MLLPLRIKSWNGASIMVNPSGSTEEKKLDPDSTFILNEQKNIYILGW